MAFKPGQSGNPGGRPAKSNPAALKAREYYEAAIMVHVANLADEDPNVRHKAAEALIDRGFGKPTEYIESQTEDLTPKPVEKPRFTLEELRLLISELQSRRA
jgi:hypothetical protein